MSGDTTRVTSETLAAGPSLFTMSTLPLSPIRYIQRHFGGPSGGEQQPQKARCTYLPTPPERDKDNDGATSVVVEEAGNP